MSHSMVVYSYCVYRDDTGGPASTVTVYIFHLLFVLLDAIETIQSNTKSNGSILTVGTVANLKFLTNLDHTHLHSIFL